MNPTHRDDGHLSSESLFDDTLGRLSADEQPGFERHARDCELCRQRRETLGWIRTQVVLWGDALFDSHVESAELVAYRSPALSLPMERREAIRTHLALCESCSLDLDMVSEVQDDLDSETDPGRHLRESSRETRRENGRGTASRGPLDWILGLRPAMGLAVLLVLLVPAVVGIRSWLGPGPDGEVEDVLALPAAQELLLGDARGDDDEQTVTLNDSGPLVLRIEIPMRSSPGVRYDATIENRSGQVSWTERGLVSQDEYGSFLLVVRAGALPPASYRLRIEEWEAAAAADGGESMTARFDFPFDLRGASGTD